MATMKDVREPGTETTIPHWLNGRINEDDLFKIRAQVMRSEKGTSGEIVPMVVRSSASFGHIPLTLFLLALVVFWTLATQISHTYQNIPFWQLELSSVVLSALTAWALKDLTLVRHYLSSPHDLALSVHHRAQLEFYQSNIKASHRHTGVLIFISLLERRAVILADEAVSVKVDDERWSDAIDILLKETSQGKLAQGICDAIAHVGQILSENLPIHIGDRDELANDLIMKE